MTSGDVHEVNIDDTGTAADTATVEREPVQGAGSFFPPITNNSMTARGAAIDMALRATRSDPRFANVGSYDIGDLLEIAEYIRAGRTSFGAAPADAPESVVTGPPEPD